MTRFCWFRTPLVQPQRLVAALLAFAAAGAASAADTRAVLQVFGAAGAGCGTLVRVDQQQGWLLTAAHVVEGAPRCRVRWESGVERDARVVASDAQLDVALVQFAAPADALVLPLAGTDEWPRQGDVVELIGYGGGNLRHWSAKVNGYALTGNTNRHQTLSIDTKTIGGDSGGAIALNDRLVGVIWGGPLAGPRGPMLATHGTCCVAIDALVRRAVPNWPQPSAAPLGQIAAYPPCFGGQCPIPARPAPRVPQPAPSGDCCAELRAELRKLQVQLDALAQPAPAIDMQRAMADAMEQMATDPRFRGPPGQRGAPGRDGLDGAAAASPSIDALAEQVKQRLAGSLRIRVSPVRR